MVGLKLCHTQCTCMHGLLHKFGPENGVCNYLALEKINGMLVLRIRAFSPPEL